MIGNETRDKSIVLRAH